MSREESQESDEELDRAWQAQVALQLMEQGLEGTELGALGDDDDEEAERLWALLQERNVKENAMAEEELQLQRLREMNAMLDSNPQEDDDGLLDDASEHAIAFEHLTFDTAVAEGSFGRLFKGEYLGVDVAIKNLFMSDDTEEDAKYLAREISALKGIRHPNVVAFIGVCIHETGTYIVTEWIPNGDLTNELRKEKTISWHKRISYAKDAAAAMAYLHARNIIHRDLKAENLLLTDNDSVKVCDLGFARTSKAKRRLSIAGTQLYMAPEVIVGAEYDEKCDVFSYGVVLFEIIARQPPPRRTLNESFSFNQEALWGFRPEDCPTDFWQLMVDCIKETPGERPAFEQILSRLKNLLKQVPKPTVDQTNGTGQSQAANGAHDEKHVAEHQARDGASPSAAPSLGSNEQMGLEKLTHIKSFWETKTRSELITNIVDQEKQLRIEKENMERAIREQVEREYALKMGEERRKMREQMQRELEEARLQIQRERERASQRKQPTTPPASSANPTALTDDRITAPASSPATHAATSSAEKPNSKTEILDPVKMERKIHKLQEKIKNLDATFEGNESQKDAMMGRLEEKILSLYDSAARLDALQPAGGRRKITEHSPSTTPTTTTHVGTSEPTVSTPPIATPAVPSVSLSQPPKEQPSAPKEPLAPSASPTTKPVASQLSDVPKRQAETPTAQTTSTTSEPGAPVTKWRAAHEPWKAGASTHTPKIQAATPSVPATAIATTTTTTPTASTSPSSSPTTPARSADAPEKPDGSQQGDKDDRKDPLTPTKLAKDGERERERAKEKEKKRLTISKKMKHSLLNLWERENLNEAEQKKVIEKRKNTLAKRPNNLLPRTQEEIRRYKLEMIEKYEREKRENDTLLLQRKQGTSAEKPSEGSAFGQHRSFRMAVVPTATTKSSTATDSGKGL